MKFTAPLPASLTESSEAPLRNHISHRPSTMFPKQCSFLVRKVIEHRCPWNFSVQKVVGIDVLHNFSLRKTIEHRCPRNCSVRKVVGIDVLHNFSLRKTVEHRCPRNFSLRKVVGIGVLHNFSLRKPVEHRCPGRFSERKRAAFPRTRRPRCRHAIGIPLAARYGQNWCALAGRTMVGVDAPRALPSATMDAAFQARNGAIAWRIGHDREESAAICARCSQGRRPRPF